MNIRSRLLVVLVVAALVPLYLVGWLAWRANDKARGEREDASLLARANELAADVEGFVRASLDALRADASLPAFQAYLAADATGRAQLAVALRNTLRSVAVKDPIHVMSAALIDPAGRVLGDTALASVAAVSERDNPCVAAALEGGFSVLLGPRFTPRAKSPFIFVCHPVRDARGQIIGVLRLRVSAARLQAIVWKGTLNDRLARSVLVLGRDEVVVAHNTRPDWQLHARLGGNEASDTLLRREGRLAPNGSFTRLPPIPASSASGVLLAWIDVVPERQRLALVPVRDSEWQLAIYEPESAWRAGSRAEAQTFLGLGAVLTLLLLVAAWAAAARIAQPIVRLTALADRIGIGGPMPALPVDAGGEVGRLARAMRAMTERLEETLAQLAAQVAEQRETATRLQVSESRFAALFNLSPLPLLLTDRDGDQIVNLNACFLAQFGPEAAALFGQPLSSVAGDPRYPAFVEMSKALGSHGDIDEVVQVAGGAAAVSLRVFGRAFEAGERRLAVWTCVDVTETENARHALEELNASLEQRVDQRTAELRETLERLQHTQDELVRSEKLAALGGLVAGVAHELNTPIGNGVTVASTIQDMTQNLSAEVAAGRLRKSMLDDYLASMHSATHLLTRNLERARMLVTSFKQVSVDRVTDGRRKFDLAEVIEEIATTLAPGLKGAPGKLEFSLQKISMDGYPGPIGQIITNLVGNAMLHAFEGRRDGLVTISTVLNPDGSAELCCRDNGCGMDADIRRRIFDPFFTTKFGQGGSGLGMHIVYNLVTRVLGGRIVIESQPGMGSCFRITLPVVAPYPAD
jgi:PAS domain S-box-containing protein